MPLFRIYTVLFSHTISAETRVGIVPKPETRHKRQAIANVHFILNRSRHLLSPALEQTTRQESVGIAHADAVLRLLRTAKRCVASRIPRSQKHGGSSGAPSTRSCRVLRPSPCYPSKSKAKGGSAPEATRSQLRSCDGARTDPVARGCLPHHARPTRS